MAEYACISKTGSRPVNEDAVAVLEGDNGLLCVLCDGLGGHGSGEVASRLALEAAEQAFSRPLPSGDLLPLCMELAQQALLEEQRRQGKPEELKTTMVLLHLQEGRLCWAHVGDSRLYLFRRQKLAARTLDHSVPQMLVAQGEIREKDIRFHEDRNRLTRVLGMAGEVPRFTMSDEVKAEPGLDILLCSDGFWEWLTEKEMGRLLKNSAGAQDWLEKMAQLVQKNGQGHTMDNFSAIAVCL